MMADIPMGERATVDQTPDPEDIDRAPAVERASKMPSIPGTAMDPKKMIGFAAAAGAIFIPLLMAAGVGPALAAGCTCVVKPAKQTPLSMLALAQIFEDAGVPSGAVNVITGSSSGSLMAPLISDARLRKLSFTGSTAVGKTLIEQSAEQVLRVSMELGGNAPFLVFEDADLGKAVDGAMIAKMRNGGEACDGGLATRMCTSRAPASYIMRTIFTDVVPRTTLSSTSRMRLPCTTARLALCLSLTPSERIVCVGSMKVRPT